MKHWIGTLAALLLLCSGCSGAGDVAYNTMERVTMAPMPGSSLAGVELAAEPSAVSLHLTGIPPEGKFLRLELPTGMQIGSGRWETNGAVLHLAVPANGGHEIGVTPLAGYGGEPVSVWFPLEAASRSASTPPTNPRNIITDLTWQDAGDDEVRLEWTEVNTGDYNFDGLVNINDLTPIGLFWGQYYNRYAPQAKLRQIYWVDGNRDGVISISDLQPIGAHFGSEVAGYVVKRNGVYIPHPGSGTFPTVTHADAVAHGDGTSPPYYSVILDGSRDDQWDVIPLDRTGAPGVGSSSLGFIDLRAQATIVGIELEELDIGASPYQQLGDTILRIIDPIDWPANASLNERFSVPELGTRIDYDFNSVRFSNVPHQRNLLLDIFYQPVIDLATGEAGGHPVVTSVPFSLPTGLRTIDLDVTLTVQPKPGGGYYLLIETISSDAGRKTTSYRRVDYLTGTVSRINSDNHTFDNEAALADLDRDGVSDARLIQELDYDEHPPGWALHITLEGTLLHYDELAGVIILSDAVQPTGGDDINHGDVVASFSELTLFGENADGSEPLVIPIDPTELQSGDFLVIDTLLHEDDSEQQQKFWIKSVIRQTTGS